MSVYILATLDTKGPEADFVRKRLNELGVKTKLVDVGSGTPTVDFDISSDYVFSCGGASDEQIAAIKQHRGERGDAITVAAKGAAIIAGLADNGSLSGLLALGGSAGTTIGTAAMQALRLGTPKVMVSTLASGQTRPYVGVKDIVMINSVVDIAGINPISRQVLSEAAAAMAGMVKFRDESLSCFTESRYSKKPLIAATMFGVTTPCVEHARKLLEQEGFEVVVFHATGAGGQAMESLIRDGMFAGVLDITTTELADELVGGTLSAGPTRLTAATERGIAQVVSVGALDMVNFGPMDTVPAKFAGRKFHRHNANVTLMRTTVEENAKLGEEIARKVSALGGRTVVLLPGRGVSAIDREGQAFEDDAARRALFHAIKENASGVSVEQIDAHINDENFAAFCVNKLLNLLGPNW